MQILCADLGNTRTHLSVFPPGRFVEALPRRADAVVYVSVAPSRERAFERMILRRLKRRALKLGRDLPIPVRIKSGRPWKAGADRLCNALAGYAWSKGPCIVADLGTAITVEAVSAKGELVGGLIAPGMRLMAQALHAHTELLPKVSMNGPVRFGRDTKENIRAGIDAAVEGLIESGIRRARRIVGSRAPVIGTGGDAPRFARCFDRVDPMLTLRGVFLTFALHLVKKGPALLNP
jgi:type III pantothenate kinase